MLSFSSYGSAKHERVTMVADAVKIANEKYPDIAVDGELQLDAALVPEVAALKAPNSKVAGKANTLVFPSLEAGTPVSTASWMPVVMRSSKTASGCASILCQWSSPTLSGWLPS